MDPREILQKFRKECEMSEQSRDDRDDEEIRYTRHTPRWWETWLNPTSVMVLFGAIVWGVQLNFSVLQNTKDISTVATVQSKILQIQQEMSTQNTRIWLLVEKMDEDLDQIEATDGTLRDRIRALEQKRSIN